MSIVWIYMIANVIVDLLILFGMLTGINTAILGLTVLSWGNSVGDAFASMSISKKGFGEMAVTGCVAGPVFNLMLGLGLITVKCNLLLEDGIEFSKLDPQGMLTLSIILASILILSTLSWLTVSNKFKMVDWHAKMLIMLYAAVIILIACLSI
jgi:sodium/potassium/calcium exchanger 6